MRETRKQLLSLIEQRPRQVRELAAITNMKVGAIYEALRDFRIIGIVRVLSVRAVGRDGARKPCALPGAVLHADGLG